LKQIKLNKKNITQNYTDNNRVNLQLPNNITLQNIDYETRKFRFISVFPINNETALLAINNG